MKHVKLGLLFIALICIHSVILADDFKVEGQNYKYYNLKGRKYNPASVITVRGEISAIEIYKISPVCTGFMHLSLKGNNETIRIMLAPQRFLEGKIAIAKGDSVEIVGSKLTNDAGEKLIIARSIKKGDVFLELRDEKGTPKWPMRKK